jgi:hypothetical protein
MAETILPCGENFFTGTDSIELASCLQRDYSEKSIAGILQSNAKEAGISNVSGILAWNDGFFAVSMKTFFDYVKSNPGQRLHSIPGYGLFCYGPILMTQMFIDSIPGWIDEKEEVKKSAIKGSLLPSSEMEALDKYIRKVVEIIDRIKIKEAIAKKQENLDKKADEILGRVKQNIEEYEAQIEWELECKKKTEPSLPVLLERLEMREEVPAPPQQAVNLSKLNYVIIASGYTSRLVSGRHYNGDTFDCWEPEKGIKEEDDQDSDSDDHKGLVKHSRDDPPPNCSSSVRRFKNRGALFVHDGLWGDGLTVIQECEDQEELLALAKPFNGSIVFRCSKMAEAFNIHHGLVSADYCSNMDYITDISGFKLSNGKSVVVFESDSESG